MREVVFTVDAGQEEVIQGGRVVIFWCTEHSFQISDSVIMWSEEEELGTFRAETDGLTGEIS